MIFATLILHLSPHARVLHLLYVLMSFQTRFTLVSLPSTLVLDFFVSSCASLKSWPGCHHLQKPALTLPDQAGCPVHVLSGPWARMLHSCAFAVRFPKPAGQLVSYLSRLLRTRLCPIHYCLQCSQNNAWHVLVFNWIEPQIKSCF